MAMRTQEELAAKYEEHKKAFLGFYNDVIFPYLDYAHVKAHLKEGTTEAQWEEARRESGDLSEEATLKAFREYAVFAWGKAQDHRGISASRSVEKLTAWAWLLGRDDVVAAVEAAEYPQYGAPKLKAICEGMGFPLPDSPDLLRMAQGLPCCEGCDNGCGES